ncbi:MAG: hypothetical protein ACLQDY_19290 [Streptosporangiaceae bacterium]
MDRIIQRLRRPRLRRRERRVELLGGYPQTGPDAQPESFQPVLDEGARIQQILGGVSTLGPESVDEATGHPLDNLINAQGDSWARKLNQQYLAYLPIAQNRLGQAHAIVKQYEQLHEQDLVRLHSAEIAVETALQALGGREPEPGTSPVRVSVLSGTVPQPEVARRADRPPADGLARTLAGPSWSDSRALLTPTKVSRTELRRLLQPQDASSVPRWGEPGFRDGALLAGRPRTAYLHALALLLAAGADIGAFVQIVELVMPQQQDWVIWLVVSGLTSVVLYIAHTIGVILRELKAGQSLAVGLASRIAAWLGRRVALFVCVVIWLALGLMAFWVRMTVTLPGTVQLGSGGIGSGSGGSSGAAGIGAGGIGGGGIGGGGIGSGGGGTGSTAVSGHPPQAAVIFLGLYLATGLVAAIGAYFTHNPYRGRYAAAVRAYRKASEGVAASAYQLRRAVAIHDQQQAEIAAAKRTLDEAQAQNAAFTEQLKQTVRIRIAGMAKDPAVTDAIFSPDQSPYWPRPNVPPAG